MSFQPVLMKRTQIDEAKWNKTVDSIPGAGLYGLVETLDVLAGDWDALVIGDYRYVMPLPFRTKFGIRYVYCPMFIQRIDIYGANCTNEIRESFIVALKSYCRYFDLNVAFNYSGHSIQQRERINYILSLQQGYDSIASSYHNETKKNIKKAIERNCRFSFDIKPVDVIRLYREVYGNLASANERDYQNLKLFAEKAATRGSLLSCCVRHVSGGRLLFAALFFLSGNRIYYLLGAPTAEGRAARAGYFMIDSIIRKYAGTAQFLDFEGSDIPNVATFYKKFNPIAEPYYHLHYNNLPWFIRLFKK